MAEYDSGFSAVNVAINHWETQLAVFKAQYNNEAIQIYYLDDENEEVRVNDQMDYDYASQLAFYSNGHQILRMIIRDKANKLIGQPNLRINFWTENSKSPSRTSSMTTMTDEKVCKDVASCTHLSTFVKDAASSTHPSIVKDASSSTNPLTEDQDKLVAYLEKFKKDILTEINDKFTDMMQLNRQLQESKSQEHLVESDTLVSLANSYTETDSYEEAVFQAKVKRLLESLQETRRIGRLLKSAYLEEELHLSGAFDAGFITDCTIPDGTVCEPSMRFKKIWMLANTGKLNWDQINFPIEVVCIAGNISLAEMDQPRLVEDTCVNRNAEVIVELIAPEKPGIYHTEWVLSCNGFQFGPRVWCTIQVSDSSAPNTSSRLDSASSGSTSGIETFEEDELLVDLNTNIEPALVEPSHEQSKLNTQEIMNMSAFSQECHFSRQFSDDLDDDFVVVPDCFDLTKKWQTQTSPSLDETNNSSEKELENFVEIGRDHCYSESNTSQQLLDLEIVERNMCDMNQRPLTPTSSVEAQYPIPQKLEHESSPKAPVFRNLTDQTFTELIKLNVELDKQQQQQQQETQEDNEKMEIKVHKPTVDYPIVEKKPLIISPANQQKESTSAFDLMKNAFSNLRGPLYAGNLDIEFKNDKQQTKPIVTQKTPLIIARMPNQDYGQSNMDKLIQMGFANRQLNNRLLRKFDNNMDQVVAHLLENINDNWSSKRH